MHLGPDQLSRFEDDGFLVLERFFDDEELTAMQGECDRLMEFLINSSLANQRRSARLDLRQKPDGSQVLRKIQPVIDISTSFRILATDSRLIGCLEQLMEDPELMEEKLNYKQHLPEPVAGLELHTADDSFLVHNDWTYHREQGYPPQILNAAIAIDACRPDSGPLKVWPGTHKRHVEHDRVIVGDGYRSYQVPAGYVDPAAGVDLVTPWGSLILFHGLLLHSSAPNISGRPRRLMIFSYCPRGSGPAADARNGPTRRAESVYEARYRELKERGELSDRFQAPGAVVG